MRMDTFYIIIICLIIAVLIAAAVLSYLLSEKQRAVRARKKYYNMLELYNAYCVILCNYLQGIDHVKDLTPCAIYAGNDNLTIVTKEKPPKVIKINLAKVQTFDKFNREKIIPYMNGLILSYLQSYNEFIILQCLSDNFSEQEIFFTLDIPKKQKAKNDYYHAQCDIFTFISPLISKQEITMEL